MFSKDKFRLDLIGLYLGGHEPGNINLYRIAKERGLSDTFNPWDVPVYEWIDGEAVAAQADATSRGRHSRRTICRRAASRSITWSTSHSTTTDTRYDEPYELSQASSPQELRGSLRIAFASSNRRKYLSSGTAPVSRIKAKYSLPSSLTRMTCRCLRPERLSS